MQLILRANLDANAANATPADMLKFLFHIFGTFFGIEVSLSVCRRLFSKDRACRAGGFAKIAISAPVFDHGQFAFERHIR